MTDFDWTPFEGDRWSPNTVGDQIVGAITKITTEKGQRGDVPVVTVKDKASGVEREIWPPIDLKRQFADAKVQAGDQVAIKLIDLKNTGQPQPMKVFALKVKKAETDVGDETTPSAPSDPDSYGDDEEPF